MEQETTVAVKTSDLIRIANAILDYEHPMVEWKKNTKEMADAAEEVRRRAVLEIRWALMGEYISADFMKVLDEKRRERFSATA